MAGVQVVEVIASQHLLWHHHEDIVSDPEHHVGQEGHTWQVSTVFPCP